MLLFRLAIVDLHLVSGAMTEHRKFLVLVVLSLMSGLTDARQRVDPVPVGSGTS
jgi:hypothetical protein